MTRRLLPSRTLLAVALAIAAAQQAIADNAGDSSVTARPISGIDDAESGVLTHQPERQRNVVPPPELRFVTPPRAPAQPAPPLRPTVAEQPLWDLLGQQRYAELRHAIAELRTRHPDWRPPAKLITLLETGDASQAIEDEQPLWELLGQQRYVELRHAIAELRTRHPDWRPPAKLIALLETGDASQTIEHAVANDHDEALIDLAQRHPEHFDCNRVHALWALADAWDAKGQPHVSIALHQRVLAECPHHRDRRISLQQLQRYLPTADTAVLLDQEAAAPKPAEEQPHYADMRYRFYLAWLGQTLADPDHSDSLTLVAAIEDDIDTRRDATAATMAGWAHLNQAQHGSATTWFGKAHQWQPSEEASYGLALSHFRGDDLPGATTVIRRHGPSSDRQRQLLADTLVAQALAATDEQHHTAALAFLNEAAHHRPLTPDEQRMRAWSLYQTKDYPAAQTAFEALYRQHPDANSATGLYFSHARQETWDQLAVLVETQGGPITPLWHTHLAEQRYYRKRFLSAAALAPKRYPKLANIDSPSIHLGMLLRHRSGDEGLSQLTLIKLPVIEGVYVHDGVHRFALRLDRVDMDSGTLPDNAVVGRFPTTAPQDYAFDPTTDIDAGLEPHLSYQRDGWLTPTIGIGMTPSDGIVSSKFIWHLGLAGNTEEGEWGVSLSAKPMRDSILSYVGMVDPYGGSKWGRVLKTGLKLTLNQNVTADWSLQAATEIARLKGHRVADNDYLALRFGLGKALNLKHFDYLALGPFLDLERYDRNLSHFTLGHGGYFSPQQLIRVGVALRGLTPEGRSFIIDAEGGLGYQRHREDSSPLFPLSPENGSDHASARRSGPGVNLQARGVWLIDRHWQVGGGLGMRASPRYDDVYGNLFVRMTFKPRKAVFSYDLPEFAFETLF